MKSVRTWDDLLIAIVEMTPEQRTQPIQCVQHDADGDAVMECKPGIAFGTVEEMEFAKCRSVYDNKYHGGDFVLLMDVNQFGEDGVVAWVLRGGEAMTPIYGKHGQTDLADQCGPSCGSYDDNDFKIGSGHAEKLKYRLDHYNRTTERDATNDH